MKATYKSIDLDKRQDMDDIQDALEGITGARSVHLLKLLIDKKYSRFSLTRISFCPYVILIHSVQYLNSKNT